MKRVLLAFAFAMLAAAPAKAQEFITILTGGTAGVYYPLGVALSQIYGRTIPNAKVTVQSTKASAENLNLLQAGKGELAFTQTDTAAQAWRADAEVGFTAKLDKLRGIAVIYPNIIQIVASADSGVKTVADLKGKRVSVGAPKSGTEINARLVLAAAGVKYSDLGKVEYLPFAESVNLMKNRQIDATLQSAGLGVASLKDLSVSMPIVMVEVSKAVIDKIGDPVFIPAVIPAGTYEGMKADVATVATGNMLATHAGVSDAVAYAMARDLWTNLDLLGAAHAVMKSVKLDRAATVTPVPLHPGAEKFYKEMNVM